MFFRNTSIESSSRCLTAWGAFLFDSSGITLLLVHGIIVIESDGLELVRRGQIGFCCNFLASIELFSICQ